MKKIQLFIILISAFVLLVSCLKKQSNKHILIPESKVLQEIALNESKTPVHPGLPGEIPFWNTFAIRFIYAPAFNFPEIEGAESYKFIIQTELRDSIISFTAEKPWVPLSEVWSEIPVGRVKLTVKALKNNEVIGYSGEREFYRASPYKGPYHAKRMDYGESAAKLLRYLFNAPYIQYWKLHGDPDPSYGLYCYPSKMFSAVINGMLLFSELTEDQTEKNEAIQIALFAADYLINISEKQSKPLEYFPPTYTGPIYADMVDEWRGESLADRIMLIYPATAGIAYLDLYDYTQDKKYFDAAIRIAETYRRIQLENGTWHLLLFVENGEPVASNFVIPTGVYQFLNRLENQYGVQGYEECLSRAMKWIEENLANDFNWEGQFEDQKPGDRYMNLSKGQACSYALHLFKIAKGDTNKISLAEEIVRFAEDQFVIWENPVPVNEWKISSENWITPCVLEQYNFYTPVNASSANMIELFTTTYENTGNTLYLVKAIDLANTLLKVQDPESGHYPTYLVSNLLGQEGWINCMVYTAGTVKELNDFLKSLSPDREILLL